MCFTSSKWSDLIYSFVFLTRKRACVISNKLIYYPKFVLSSFSCNSSINLTEESSCWCKIWRNSGTTNYHLLLPFITKSIASHHSTKKEKGKLDIVTDFKRKAILFSFDSQKLLIFLLNKSFNITYKFIGIYFV